MPSYKFYYFDGRGRGEVVRLILAAAGISYQDIRIDEDNAWPAEKATGKYAFGQLPTMEIDGVMIAQSRAIGRYIASQHGLTGKTAEDNLKIDSIADTMEDLFAGWAEIIFKIEDETKKAEAQKAYESEFVPNVLGHLEKILKSNKGGDGYLVTDGLTWADLAFYSQIENNINMNAKVLDNYPKLKALYGRIAALPKIAAWLKKRPNTDW
ncbi:S-crystallin SL11-like [Glandiceps talaboti]